MLRELIDEWNRDQMSEPPPVYSRMIFPGRRVTANQENKETHTLFLQCSARMYCSHYEPKPYFLLFFFCIQREDQSELFV